MRSSLLRQRQNITRPCESASRRYLNTQTRNATSTRTQSIILCKACSSRQNPAPRIAIQRPSQRRMRSTATSTTTSETRAPETSSATAPPPNPSHPKTHYEFFPKTLPQGPPPSGPFAIDIRALRREFLQLQAVAHPDLHPPHLKSRAEATSARINEAYKTLQSPLLRAQYLLELRGMDVATDEKAKVEDPELLMEVLEAREEIEGVEEEEGLLELKGRNEVRMRESERVLGEVFAQGDVGRAAEEAVRLRYWVNIQESLDGWERGKGGGDVHH